jgi:hypothetical protein
MLSRPRQRTANDLVERRATMSCLTRVSLATPARPIPLVKEPGCGKRGRATMLRVVRITGASGRKEKGELS